MRRTSTPSTAKRSGELAKHLTTAAARWKRTARSMVRARVCVALLSVYTGQKDRDGSFWSLLNGLNVSTSY